MRITFAQSGLKLAIWRISELVGDRRYGKYIHTAEKYQVSLGLSKASQTLRLYPPILFPGSEVDGAKVPMKLTEEEKMAYLNICTRYKKRITPKEAKLHSLAIEF